MEIRCHAQSWPHCVEPRPPPLTGTKVTKQTPGVKVRVAVVQADDRKTSWPEDAVNLCNSEPHARGVM